MVSQEVISFIQEQMESGRDVRTIRNYLLSRGLEQSDVDAAFDKVFRPVESSKPKTHKRMIEKLVIGGVSVVLILLVVFAFTLYNSITPEQPPVNPGTTTLTPPDIPADEGGACDYEDTEKKYDCYINLFQQGEYYCYEIEDEKEREFCYRTKDIYSLSA